MDISVIVVGESSAVDRLRDIDGAVDEFAVAPTAYAAAATGGNGYSVLFEGV